jgi:hypothetical protein
MTPVPAFAAGLAVGAALGIAALAALVELAWKLGW